MAAHRKLVRETSMISRRGKKLQCKEPGRSAGGRRGPTTAQTELGDLLAPLRSERSFAGYLGTRSSILSLSHQEALSMDTQVRRRGIFKTTYRGTWNGSNVWRLGPLCLGFQPYFAWKRISDRG